MSSLNFWEASLFMSFVTWRFRSSKAARSAFLYFTFSSDSSKPNWSVQLDFRILKLKQVILGCVNNLRISNMKKVMTSIDKKLRSRIRVIIWRQWKVSRKQVKSLVQLGIPEEEEKGLTFC
jgi:hypothetical protein